MAASTQHSSQLQDEDNNLHDSDPNIQSSPPPTKQEAAAEASGGEDPPRKLRWWSKVKNSMLIKPKGKSSKSDGSKEASTTDVDELRKSIDSSIDDITKLKLQEEALDPNTSKWINNHLKTLKQVYSVINGSDLQENARMDVLRDLYKDLIKLKTAASSDSRAGADKQELLKNLKFSSTQSEKVIDDLIESINSSINDITKLKLEKDIEQHTSDLITGHLNKLYKAYEAIKGSHLPVKERRKELYDLDKDLIKLKIAVAPSSTAGADKKDPLKNVKFSSVEAEKKIRGGRPENMPHLHENHVFEASMEYKEFVARYDELEDRVKLCLLCFSIFPAYTVIKKRLMMQWWVAEGYASSEEEADDYFKFLIEKGFIEPVNENHSLSIGSCRIHPFNQYALVALAERASFFKFEVGGKPTQEFDGCFQACLVGKGLISYDKFQKESKDNADKVIKGLTDDLEKLHLLMNVKENILEFKKEWFGKMRNVNVLFLGRWNALPTHHIEVEDMEFLKMGLKNMNFVKFLSLQGVSNIIELPDSMLEMTNLSLLDLRACYNLEKIPENIGLRLERLTHLDMTECYLLAHMPKSLSKLKLLKVLKGFYVDKDNTVKHCTLGDLESLEYLEKLCIYTNLKDFPEYGDVQDLGKLKKLCKLTITWGVGVAEEEKNAKKEEPEAEGNTDNSKKQESSSSSSSSSNGNSKLSPCLKSLDRCFEKSDDSDKNKGNAQLPERLNKLDLKCFPKSETPDWLKLQNLKNTQLKKLYIRGGKFCDLGQHGDGAWGVEELRLKYLADIEMDWKRFQELFPELKYLEQVSCPRLTFFPCDVKGVWIKPE